SSWLRLMAAGSMGTGFGTSGGSGTGLGGSAVRTDVRMNKPTVAVSDDNMKIGNRRNMGSLPPGFGTANPRRRVGKRCHCDDRFEGRQQPTEEKPRVSGRMLHSVTIQVTFCRISQPFSLR